MKRKNNSFGQATTKQLFSEVNVSSGDMANCYAKRVSFVDTTVCLNVSTVETDHHEQCYQPESV